MENDRLPWESGFSTSGGQEGKTAIEVKGTKLRLPKAGLVLLVSSEDSKDCCAANFERSVFRDKHVVDCAKSSFMHYRLDRSSGPGQELYTKFSLDAKKPAILLLDEESKLIYKTQKCTDPKHVLKAMNGLMGLLKTKLISSVRAEKRLGEVDALLERKRYSEAVRRLKSIDRKLVFKDMRDQAQKKNDDVYKIAVTRLREGLELEKKSDFAGADAIYREVRKTFFGFEKVKNYTKKALRRIDEKRKAAENQTT